MWIHLFFRPKFQKLTSKKGYKMKKFKKLFVLLLSIGAAFAALTITTQTSNVEAARWHRGTPKVLRGKYKTHHYGADLMAIFTIRKNSIVSWQAGMPTLHGYHVRYKRLGKNKYLLKYNNKRFKNVFRGEKNVKTKVTKVGKRFKISFDSHWFYKH